MNKMITQERIKNLYEKTNEIIKVFNEKKLIDGWYYNNPFKKILVTIYKEDDYNSRLCSRKESGLEFYVEVEERTMNKYIWRYQKSLKMLFKIKHIKDYEKRDRIDKYIIVNKDLAQVQTEQLFTMLEPYVEEQYLLIGDKKNQIEQETKDKQNKLFLQLSEQLN